MIRKMLFVGAMVAMPAVASAGVLDSSFESAPGSFDGWAVSSSSPRTTLGAGTIGVTDGVQSLALTMTGTDAWGWDIVKFYDATLFSAAVAAGGTIEFDVTYDVSTIPQTEVTYIAAHAGGDGGLSPWVQTGHLGYSDGMTNETLHVSLSLAGDLGFLPGDSWYKVVIGMAGDWLDASEPRADEATIYIDNIVVTPEPASLALLGLGGLAIAGRRRA